jgi:hypothetical protein
MFMRRLPRRRHLRGTWLHRVVGQRLFDRALWRPDRRSVATGLALGVFIALTPFFGLHFILAVVGAFALRVNIPAALGGCLVSNPVTVTPILALQLALGRFMVQPLTSAVRTEIPAAETSFLAHAWPLSLGSLASAVLAGALAYVLVMVAWRERPRPPVGPPPVDLPHEPT